MAAMAGKEKLSARTAATAKPGRRARALACRVREWGSQADIPVYVCRSSYGNGLGQCGRFTSGYLRRKNEPHHVRRLLWCRPAAPDRVDGWRLVRDVRPAVARQLTEFRKPIRES